MPELAPEQLISHSSGLLILSALRVQLFSAKARSESARLKQGMELAGRLIGRAQDSQRLPIVLKALLLRGQMHAVAGDEQAGLADVARAIELAEPEGAISTFVEEGPPVAAALAELLEQGRLGDAHADYIRRILAAYTVLSPPAQTGGEPASWRPHAQGVTPGAPEPAEGTAPLTDREQNVLRLMAEGLKYQEIAVGMILALANHSAFSMIRLSDLHAAATNAAAREQAVLAGEAVIAGDMWHSTSGFLAWFPLLGRDLLKASRNSAA